MVYIRNGILLLLLYCSELFSYLLTYHDITAKNSSLIPSIAINNDVNTIWSNPSNIEHIDTAQFSFNYGLPYFGLKGSEYVNTDTGINLEPGITEHIVCIGVPLGSKYGYSGIGVYRLSLGKFFNDNVFLVSYGKKIFTKLLLGSSIKIFYREYGKDVYTEHYQIFQNKGYSKTDFTIDIVLTYKLLQHLNFAFGLHNITQPNLSFSGSKEDKFPVVLRTGVGINLESYKFGCELDYDLFTETTNDTKFFVGGEYNLLKTLVVLSSVGIGNDNYYEFSSGFKIKIIKYLSLTYSFTYPLSGIKELFTHKISIDISFLQQRVKEIKQPLPAVQQEQPSQQQVVQQTVQQKEKLKIKPSVLKKLREALLKKKDEKK